MHSLLTEFAVRVTISVVNVFLAFFAGWWLCERSQRTAAAAAPIEAPASDR